MQDLMIRYIKLIGTDVKQRAELCNRTQPNLLDLQRTFDDMGINVEELSEYVEQFDCKALVTDPVPLIPQPSETHLNYLKPGSREVLHRPYHIYDYLPPMYPEMEGTEDQNMASMSTNIDDIKAEIKTEAPTGMFENVICICDLCNFDSLCMVHRNRQEICSFDRRLGQIF